MAKSIFTLLLELLWEHSVSPVTGLIFWGGLALVVGIFSFAILQRLPKWIHHQAPRRTRLAFTASVLSAAAVLGLGFLGNWNKVMADAAPQVTGNLDDRLAGDLAEEIVSEGIASFPDYAKDETEQKALYQKIAESSRSALLKNARSKYPSTVAHIETQTVAGLPLESLARRATSPAELRSLCRTLLGSSGSRHLFTPNPGAPWPWMSVVCFAVAALLPVLAGLLICSDAKDSIKENLKRT